MADMTDEELGRADMGAAEIPGEVFDHMPQGLSIWSVVGWSQDVRYFATPELALAALSAAVLRRAGEVWQAAVV